MYDIIACSLMRWGMQLMLVAGALAGAASCVVVCRVDLLVVLLA